MVLHVGEGREQRLAQRRRSIEVAVVCALLPGVLPKPLGCVEIRRVRRKGKHFDLPPVFGKELQNLGLLVIRGVILNQVYPMAAPVIMGQQIFIEEGQISLRIEVFSLVTPGEITAGHADRGQDFLSVAFSARGNLGLLAAPRPGAIESGRLPEGGLVFINDQRPFFPGVFFRFGWV